MNRALKFSVACCMAAFSVSAWAEAPVPQQADPLASQFRNVAVEISKVLKDLGADSCKFGNITPQQGNSEFGKEFISQIEAELELAGISVKRDAPILIVGDFLTQIPEDNTPSVRVSLRFVKNGQPVAVRDLTLSFAIEAKIDRMDEAGDSAFFNLHTTLSIPTDKSLHERRQLIKTLAADGGQDRSEIAEVVFQDNEGRTLQEQAVRVRDGKGFAIQIRREGMIVDPRIVESKVNTQSFPFVNLGRDDVYTVRLINPTEFEVAVELEIDGVNAFTFFAGTNPPRHFLVPPRSFLDVNGWLIELDDARDFQVVTFAESARNQAGFPPPADSLGVISAAFRYAWVKDPPPDDHSARNATQGGGSQPDLTGLGAHRKVNFTQVKRRLGYMSDVIHIRYGKSDSAGASFNDAPVSVLP